MKKLCSLIFAALALQCAGQTNHITICWGNSYPTVTIMASPTPGGPWSAIGTVTNGYSFETETVDATTFFALDKPDYVVICVRNSFSMSLCSGQVISNGVATAAPLTIDLDDASNSGSVIVNWTQGTQPDTNEVWRSIDSGAYTRIANLAGSFLTFTDTTLTGNYISYKVRAVRGGVPSSYTSFLSVHIGLLQLGGNTNNTDLVFNFDDEVVAASGCTGITMTKLRRVDSQIDTIQRPNITTLSFPVLKSVGGVTISNSKVTSFAIPLVTDCGSPGFGTVEAQGCANLASIDISGITNSISNVQGSDSPVLTTVTFNASAVFSDGANIGFFDNGQGGCALDVTTVNRILRIAASSPAQSSGNMQISLAGGSNAAPTGQGLIDKATLVLSGNFVQTN